MLLWIATAGWQNWIVRLGSLGLVLMGLLDNSVIPVPGSIDALTIILSASNRKWWPFYAFVAVLSSMLGAYVTYRVARKGGKEALEKEIGKRRAEKAYGKFGQEGFVALFIACILPPPFPLVPVVMAAGAMQYPPKKFLAAIAAGRGIRYTAVAYIGYRYGEGILGFFAQYKQPILYALIALGVLGGIAALMYFKWYRPLRQREERQRGEAVEDFPIPGRSNRAKEDQATTGQPGRRAG